MQLIFSGIKNK